MRMPCNQRFPSKHIPRIFSRAFHRHSQPSRRPSSKILNISAEVQDAVQNGKPIVALETTIYTHGFPYPDNIELASRLESVVRLNGGIPATVGVLHGVARVGLTAEELIEIASPVENRAAMKISRRDLPFITGLGIAGKKINGGTTIAGTMILAEMAGIEVFGTGGLGGVHRGGEITMDISADLTELGRTPVAVISSGCKSFLDIRRTLEYLETQGVGVATFADGRSGDIDLPAFWTRDSGVRSPSVVQDEKEAAAIIYARKLLNIQSGLFFANPIPLQYSIPNEEIDKSIKEAVQDAERQGITGHANTPFILARIKDLTSGKSIPANRALVESNVARATKIAVELAQLKSRGTSRDTTNFMPVSNVGMESRPRELLAWYGQAGNIRHRRNTGKEFSKTDIIVAGSVAVDLSCNYAPPDNDSTIPLNQTSNPAIISSSIGGVGHNVAMAAHLVREGTSVRLCSFVADDLAGKTILSSLEANGLDTSTIKLLHKDGTSTVQTAQYVAINDKTKELVMAMADMSIIGSSNVDFSPWQAVLDVSKPKWVIVDSNWHESTLHQWISGAKQAGAKVAYEPVSVAKSAKIFSSSTSTSQSSLPLRIYPNNSIDIATPNIHELAAMHSAAREKSYFEPPEWWAVIDSFGIPSTGIGPKMQLLASKELVEKGTPQMMIQLLPFIPTIITKLGPKGILLTSLLPHSSPLLTLPVHAPYILSRSNSSNFDSDPNSSFTPNIGGIYMRLFPPPAKIPLEEIASVNAVGDTFLGVLVAGLVCRNNELRPEGRGDWNSQNDGMERELDVTDERLIVLAQKAAGLTLRWGGGVSPRVKGLAEEMWNLIH